MKKKMRIFVIMGAMALSIDPYAVEAITPKAQALIDKLKKKFESNVQEENLIYPHPEDSLGIASLTSPAPEVPHKDVQIPEKRLDGAAFEGVSDSEQVIPKQDRKTSDLIKRVTERLEKIRKKLGDTSNDSALYDLRAKPPTGIGDRINQKIGENKNEDVAIEIERTVPIVHPPRISVRSEIASSPRTFGEISDEELIKYAQENLWGPERAKKHNPPYTPPYRPKKKKSTTAAKAAPKTVAKKKSADK